VFWTIEIEYREIYPIKCYARQPYLKEGIEGSSEPFLSNRDYTLSYSDNNRVGTGILEKKRLNLSINKITLNISGLSYFCIAFTGI
jgi:hypothetical protein